MEQARLRSARTLTCALLLTGALGFASAGSASPIVLPIDPPLDYDATNLAENAVPAGAFSAPTARVTGQCQVLGGGALCGLTFGAIGSPLGVGDPDLPEPASALLLVGFAVAGLWFARRGNA